MIIHTLMLPTFLLLLLWLNNINISLAIPTFRIVNGTNAVEGEFPYMVSLRYWSTNTTESHQCGGSIISKNWILTAAHCLEYVTIDLVRVGQVILDDGSQDHSYSIPVLNSYFHPDYNELDHAINDIALIELSIPLNFTDTIRPIKLPEADDVIPFNEKGWLVGWGVVSDGSYEPSSVLQKVRLTLFSDDYCLNEFLDDYSSVENLCVGNRENTKGQCTGDSGGPLVINGVQWGIVSWSFKPCISAPGVFSRISNPAYREWIRNVTQI